MALSALIKQLGEGNTVILNVFASPGHVVPPLELNGVTVIVAVIGLLVLLTAVKQGIFPVPLAPNPILVLLFVHV
jgi:hypothetical protein